MKQTLILLLLLSSVFSISQYSTDRYHNSNSIIKFNIKSYSISEVLNDSLQEITETLSFDSLGRLSKLNYPNRNSWEKYTYDSLGRIVELISFAPDIDFYEISKYFYSNQKLDSIYISDSTAVKYLKKYFYDDALLTREETYRVNSNRNYSSVWYNCYDENGFLQYTGKYKGSNQQEFIQDSKGKLMKFVSRKNGEAVLIHTFKYDGVFRVQGEMFNLEINRSNAYRIEYNEIGLPSKYYSCDNCKFDDTSNLKLKYIYTYQYK